MNEARKKTPMVTISGAGGRIAFELIPLLINGLAFGQDQRIILNLFGK